MVRECNKGSVGEGDERSNKLQGKAGSKPLELRTKRTDTMLGVTAPASVRSFVSLATVLGSWFQDESGICALVLLSRHVEREVNVDGTGRMKGRPPLREKAQYEDFDV